MHLSGLQDYIIAFGYVGIFLTIFAESGFLLGFFLPGDSLLFTLGLLASQGTFNIWILLPLAIVAAILGDSFGYYMGNKLGPRVFSREDSWLFKKQYLDETEAFYTKYGKKTIILARFVPIVRTFAPIFAGVGKMKYSIFLAYNVIGAFLWAGGFLTVSYVLGQRIPGIGDYLEYIILGIIFVSVAPVALHLYKRYYPKS